MSDIVIRPGELTDLTAITTIYNYFVVNTSVTFDYEPYQTHEREDWFAQFNDNRHPIFVAIVNGTLVGYAYAAGFRKKPAYDNTVETTIYLAPGTEGQGIGSQLYDALLKHLDLTGVHREIAVIALPNDASIALHHRFGFRDKGVLTEVGFKFNQHWDTLWLERPGQDR